MELQYPALLIRGTRENYYQLFGDAINIHYYATHNGTYSRAMGIEYALTVI